MDLYISRLILKSSTLLFLFLGAYYFLKADNWLANHTKTAGIILVSLLLTMIISLLTTLWIAGLYN